MLEWQPHLCTCLRRLLLWPLALVSLDRTQNTNSLFSTYLTVSEALSRHTAPGWIAAPASASVNQFGRAYTVASHEGERPAAALWYGSQTRSRPIECPRCAGRSIRKQAVVKKKETTVRPMRGKPFEEQIIQASSGSERTKVSLASNIVAIASMCYIP